MQPFAMQAKQNSYSLKLALNITYRVEKAILDMRVICTIHTSHYTNQLFDTCSYS
jgi:hypothetical protein